jgi:hypothetical protein
MAQGRRPGGHEGGEGVVELIVVAVLGFAALIVVGTLIAGAQLLFPPFRLLGWVLHGLGFLIVLPILLLVGAVAFFVFGLGAVLFCIPFLPFALLAFVLWRIRRRPRSAPIPH